MLPLFVHTHTLYIPIQTIEFLKKREEKGVMVLAINELGDLHAHFGSWGPATASWNDALDALIGPYQVGGWVGRGTGLIPIIPLGGGGGGDGGDMVNALQERDMDLG